MRARELLPHALWAALAGAYSGADGGAETWLLGCLHDTEWASYAATLSSHPDPGGDGGGLPRVCATEDRELFDWSNLVADRDRLQERPELQYRCDPDGISDDDRRECTRPNTMTFCPLGAVAAAACLTVMYAWNAASMQDCAATAVGAARVLHMALRANDRLLEFLDSSPWPFSVSDIVSIVGVYSVEVHPGDRPGTYEFAPVLGGDSPRLLAAGRPWHRGEAPWLRAEAAAQESLAAVARWAWPPALARGGADAAGGLARARAPWRARVWAFGTHCSVMADPVSAIALLLPGEFDLQVTWRGTKDYCGFHSGNWPVVRADRASAVREVFEAYSEKEADQNPKNSHRDSLRAPADFEKAFRAALALEGAAFAQADVVLCSEPAIVCAIAHAEGKAIIGYFGVHVAFMIKGSENQQDLYRRFSEQLAKDPRTTLATVAPYISMQSLYHMPVEIPAIRPLSAYTLPARYTASRPDEVLVNKRPMAFWDVSYVLNLCARAAGDAVHFRDAGELHKLGRMSFDDWGAFRAGIYFPYDWLQTMAFYDWVNMGIPTFVPDTPLYTFSRGTNAVDEWQATLWRVPQSAYPHHYSDWDDIAGRAYWWLLTDFCALPGVFTFGSAGELLAALGSQELLWRLSGQLRAGHLGRVAGTVAFWKTALLRALGA